MAEQEQGNQEQHEQGLPPRYLLRIPPWLQSQTHFYIYDTKTKKRTQSVRPIQDLYRVPELSQIISQIIQPFHRRGTVESVYNTETGRMENRFVPENDQFYNFQDEQNERIEYTPYEDSPDEPFQFKREPYELDRISPDEQQGRGIDFKKIHWGELTKDLNTYNKTHDDKFKDLHAFAIYIEDNPELFSKIIQKRARFYINILIHKKI
jgi:hypothetical protein